MEQHNLNINIKNLRIKLGFSQEDLAKRLNVSSQAVSKWENGESKPSIDTLVQISRIFHTSLDSLVTGVVDYDEYNGKDIINFKLKQLYYAYHRKEQVNTLINGIVDSVISANSDKDLYWTCSARLMLKGTILAMLEDESITEAQFNIDKIKKILQFDNLDKEDRISKINKYFSSKSSKCRETVAIMLNNALSTTHSILMQVATYVNMLNY